MVMPFVAQDLGHIMKTKRLSNRIVTYLFYQLLRGLKVSASLIIISGLMKTITFSQSGGCLSVIHWAESVCWSVISLSVKQRGMKAVTVPVLCNPCGKVSCEVLLFEVHFFPCWCQFLVKSWRQVENGYFHIWFFLLHQRHRSHLLLW